MDDYILEDRTMGLTTMNLIAIPMFVVMMGTVYVAFAALHGMETMRASIDAVYDRFWLALVVFVLSIVAHEAIHGLGWMVFGGVPFDKMKYGVKSLTPYAHSKVAMPARGYRIGAALPGIVLGVLPALAGLATGNGVLAFYGALMFGAASGDLMILWMLRDVGAATFVQDHPTEAGAQILRPV